MSTLARSTTPGRPAARLATALAALAALLVLASPAAARPVAAGKPPARIVAQIPSLPFVAGNQAPGTFVATAGADRELFVALIVQRGRLAVYLCDGNRVSEWFGGRLSEGRFDLRTKKRTRIVGQIGEGAITGSVTLAGKEALPYAARRAQAEEGLFLGRDTRFRGAYKYRWIRIGDSVRGSSAEDAGGIKGSVAVTQPALPPTTTPTGPGSGGGGGGGGTGTQPVPTLSCEEIFNEMSRINFELSQVRKKVKQTLWDASRIALMLEQLAKLGTQYFSMDC
jgi:hypothetical protein